MLRIDRLTGRMTLTPIISWREAEFIAAYDKGAQGPHAQRSPIERAVIAFISPNLLRLEREFAAKNDFQMVFHEFDWRLNDLTRPGGLTPRMDLGLTDKIAIVTGSSRGLGLASARALVAEGCRVCLCARGEERLAEAAVEVEPRRAARDGADRAGRRLDRRRRRAGHGDARSRRFGGIDILVNNVGKAGGARLLGTTDAEWQAAFDETLFPAIRASRLAVPLMRQRGGGVIILIASIWGRESGGRMTYNAVKAAEISLAKAMAQQLAPMNIRVNSVAPGSILFPGGSW